MVAGAPQFSHFMDTFAFFAPGREKCAAPYVGRMPNPVSASGNQVGNHVRVVKPAATCPFPYFIRTSRPTRSFREKSSAPRYQQRLRADKPNRLTFFFHRLDLIAHARRAFVILDRYRLLKFLP